jgi:thymidylate kinase
VGVVVEFCGLPGAGKSTLARAVVARLRLQGVPTVEVMAPIGPDAGKAGRMLRKALAVARGMGEPGLGEVVVAAAQRDGRDRLARPANLLVVRHALRRARRRDPVAVMDQGPVQEWWSAALRARDREAVLAAAAADPAPEPDLLVRVDAPVEVLLERLAGRSVRQSRLEALDPAELRVVLDDGSFVLDRLTGKPVHSPGTHRRRLIRVDGFDPAAVNLVIDEVGRRRGRGTCSG